MAKPTALSSDLMKSIVIEPAAAIAPCGAVSKEAVEPSKAEIAPFQIHILVARTQF